MPADSADQSFKFESALEGESEVEAWLQSLPNNWEPITSMLTATTDQIVNELRDFSAFVKVLFTPIGRKTFPVELPPTVLCDALFDKDGNQRKLRDDIVEMHGKVPLARLLLLSCTGTWLSHLSRNGHYKTLTHS